MPMGPGVEPDVAVTSVEDAQRLQRESLKNCRADWGTPQVEKRSARCSAGSQAGGGCIAH